jgi:GntR family histidine utilization transcriptional repressor
LKKSLPAKSRKKPAKPAAPASAPGAGTLHEQIKRFITEKISDNSWPAGERLPSEHELVKQFGVSRMTVSKALRDLTTSGRIVRIAGVGSFVAEAKPQSTLLQIANIASEIRSRGHEHRCQYLCKERISASPDISAWLGVLPGESVFHIVCVHLENGTPVQLEDRYVNPKMAPTFLEQDFSEITPGEYLLKQVPVDQIEHVVDAVLPSKEQAAQLDMTVQEPCLQLTRRTWWHDTSVTWVRCLHPGARYRLGSRFRPGPEGAQ